MSMTDEFAIERTIRRLRHALDAGDFTALGELFTETATVTTPGGTAVGREALVHQAARNHDPAKQIQHLVSNVVAEVTGDEATAHMNLLAVFAASATDPAPFLLAGVDDFGLRRVDGEWLIESMTNRSVWSLNAPEALLGRIAANAAG